MASQYSRLTVCMLNISEARNQLIIERITKAAGNVSIPRNDKLKCLSTVLNIFSDHDYNRSVITIAAPAQALASCVTEACKVAYELIDLRKHHGVHPRLGAVDLVPVYPISPSVSLNQCGQIARDIGKQITEEIPGTSVFFFGTADHPKQRGLVERRKEVGWYEGRYGVSYNGINFDMGAMPTSRYGCTGVGASPYVMNCNVSVETNDAVLGREIARKICGSTAGGLPGVQAMAFEHEGCIEIACNVESYKVQTNESTISDSFYYYTSPNEIKERIKSLAENHDIDVKETTVVGYTPSEIYQMAYEALSEGNTMAWQNNQEYRM